MGDRHIPMKGNMMLRTTTHLGRRAFGLAALSAFALSACGAEKTAEFDPAGGSGASDKGGGDAPAPSEAAAPDLPQLEAGFVFEEFTKDITVAGTLQPQNSTIITPTGTLSIEGVQEIASVPADVLELEAETDEDGEELEFGAAQGEVLRALDLTFTPSSDDPYGEGAGIPATDLSIRAGGSQTHLAELGRSYENRVLLSVPEDGSAVLVISCDGHDQLVDLLTGERQEDDVAAAFYLDGRVQEPHHTFPVSVDPFPVLYGGDDDRDITSEVTLKAVGLSLTAWTEQTGWAEAGGALLVLDWTSAVSIISDLPGIVRTEGYTVTASVTAGDETATDEIRSEKIPFGPTNKKETSTLVVPVPVGTTTATVSVSGNFAINLDAAPGSYEMVGSGDREFSSDELTVEFPTSGGAPSAQPSDGGGD